MEARADVKKDVAVSIAGVGLLLSTPWLIVGATALVKPAAKVEAAKPKTWQLFSGIVTSVHDGDTITVQNGSSRPVKVRLLGIDAPEISPHGGQQFGEAARGYLSAKVLGRQVTVHWKNKDRYGRTDGQIEMDGKDVCRQMVAAGLA